MRILLFADLHLDMPFAWAPLGVARRRRQALRNTLTRIVDLAGAQGVDAVCCAGDLFEHERVAPDAACFLRAQFARLQPTPVLIAPGNHDWYGPSSLYHRTDWSPNVRIFTGDRLEPHELSDGLTIWGAAHRRPANTPGFLGGFRTDRGGVNLGLFHGSLRSGLRFEEEGKQPHAPFDAEQIGASALDHVLVGHFHTPATERLYTYPGNPEPLSFGETGERGVAVLTLHGDGSIACTRHRVARTVVHDEVVDITGCASRDEIRDRVRQRLAGLAGIARVTIHGEISPEVDVQLGDLDDIAPHLEAFVTRAGPIRVGYDFAEIRKQEGTVRGRFVQEVQDREDLDEDIKRRVLITGLRALDGRDDLEVL